MCRYSSTTFFREGSFKTFQTSLLVFQEQKTEQIHVHLSAASKLLPLTTGCTPPCPPFHEENVLNLPIVYYIKLDVDVMKCFSGISSTAAFKVKVKHTFKEFTSGFVVFLVPRN